ncbi:thioredoxin-disulfide reductase [Coxiella endosymbiont of Amblyomma sculptum]|uniref:thioredoxin-disulfide reductase n=1 Tax=Coxiella endosymbiont of Amblyomma sculptum TaxID=2487929 RepID=UPI00132ECC52|nr:thioredoxin-disulfide reductase [Coxiella endosymbiont of Amblyomma sculptum]QHG92734.1 thioredoxin-disulfide reductase [Coxiella endosymbiont of Amblyomma sculptum]
MNKKKHHDLIILGSGPAGCTAAIYAARANLNPVMITGTTQGGQLMNTTNVDNWPGEESGLQGPKLMMKMQKHAERVGTKSIFDHIRKADLRQRPFLLIGSNNDDVYTCNALIVATGSSARSLGLPLEEFYLGKGISTCATCDGFFYRGKTVAVVGGGNTAVEEALYLSRIVSRVVLIHRRDKLRAEKMLTVRLMKQVEQGKVSIEWNHVVDKIFGSDKNITGIYLKSTTDKNIRKLFIDGLFIAIGHDPNTKIFEGQLDMNKFGYLYTKTELEKGRTTLTNILGVFAAGDVTDDTYRQAVTASGMGCMAALDAERYLDNLY